MAVEEAAQRKDEQLEQWFAQLSEHYCGADAAAAAAAAGDGDGDGGGPLTPPVVVEGLAGSLTRLNGLYEIAGMCEGRAAYTCEAAQHSLYFAPKYGRYYIGPDLGSENVLAFATADGDRGCTETKDAFEVWDGGKWTKNPRVKVLELSTALWGPKPDA